MLKLQNKEQNNQEDFHMRETRNAQMSVFDFYAKHELGKQLKDLSEILDEHPQLLSLIERDLREPGTASTGASGMSIESILRCLLLKQILGVSYNKLAFHLSDSLSYRTFARLKGVTQSIGFAINHSTCLCADTTEDEPAIDDELA